MTEDNLCLVATSGDMSAGAMGDSNTVYRFDSCHKKEVDNFLRLQLEWNLYINTTAFFENLQNPHSEEKFDLRKRYYNAFNQLRDLGIFTCKYDARTDWDLAIYESDELERYSPYATSDNSKKKVWGDLNKAEKAEALRASLEKKMAQEDNCSEDQAKKFLDSKVEIIIL